MQDEIKELEIKESEIKEFGRRHTVALSQEEYKSLIDMQQAARYLGYGEAQPEEQIRKDLSLCAENMQQNIQPFYTYIHVPLAWQEQEKLFAVFPEGMLPLLGSSIRKHLQGCNSVLCACLTLGSKIDNLIDQLQQKSMLLALLTDALANSGVEKLRKKLERQAAKDFLQYRINWLFGIGYGDLPLSTQKPFLDMVQAEAEIGLRCNEKYVLEPLKSVTGFIGLKKDILSF